MDWKAEEAAPHPLIIIFGPTAVGKTDLLLKLFDSNYEIISADSMQVYRYLDIGTAKPSIRVRELLPHHLIDAVDPSHQFNAGEFVLHAERLTEEISGRSRIPIIAGGTAFYLRNFIYGLPESPPSDPGIRNQLKRELKEWGLDRLVQELRRIDPVTAANVDEKDSYRVVRALEVYRSSARPLSSYRVPRKPRRDYNFRLIGLRRERAELYERIDRRVDRMFQKGLIEEFRSLLQRGYGEQDPGMRGIGYREFFVYMRGCAALGEIKERIKRNSRRYAKRQITFFKSIPGVNWFCPEDVEEIRTFIRSFLAEHAT